MSRTLQNYSIDDFYNVDKTALFYKCTPDKIMIFQDEQRSGGKESKERITFLFCAERNGHQQIASFLYR